MSSTKNSSPSSSTTAPVENRTNGFLGRGRLVQLPDAKGFDELFEHHNDQHYGDLDFRAFAVQVCDLVKDRTPHGVLYTFGNKSVRAYVYDVAGLTDEQVREHWRTMLDELAPGIEQAAWDSRESLQPAPVAPASFTDEFRAWFDAALADGWTAFVGGPWAPQVQGGPHDPVTRQIVQRSGRGHDDEDNSVILRKDDAVVWLIDRVTGWPDRPASRRREVYTHGWFENGMRAFEVPAVYDKRVVAALRGVCLACEKYVGEAEIEHVGFAGAYCHGCAPAQRRKQEFPGWYN